MEHPNPRELEEGVATGSQLASKDDDHGGKINITNENEQKTKRVAALYAFRGLTIVLMILVDDVGWTYPHIDHSPWNGCTLADFAMSFFLLIVGVSIDLSLKRVANVKHAIRKITLRTLKLLFGGILLQGGYSHAPDDLYYGVDMKKIRYSGILQRISLVYFFVALIETMTTKFGSTSTQLDHFSICTAYKWQKIGGFVAFVIYMVTTFSLYVPDWSFVVYHHHKPERFTVKCGMRRDLGPACNAVGYVDRQVWGIDHLYDQPTWRRLRACTLSSPNYGLFRKDVPTKFPYLVTTDMGSFLVITKKSCQVLVGSHDFSRGKDPRRRRLYRN